MSGDPHPVAVHEGAASETAAVVLIGFMGAGKSAVGRWLAGALQLPFIDTDQVIEQEHGPIARIFLEQGEQAFRRLESSTVCVTLAATEQSSAVIALGGGAVLSGDVRASLQRLPFVIWLTASPETHWRRVCDDGANERPLAADKAGFVRLLDERAALYNSVATHCVHNDDDRSASEVAGEIVALTLGPARGKHTS